MYKLEVELRNGAKIIRELTEIELRSFIQHKQFDSPVLYANVLTPSGVTKSILKYLV